MAKPSELLPATAASATGGAPEGKAPFCVALLDYLEVTPEADS